MRRYTLLLVILALVLASSASAQATKPALYPAMAPLEQYLIANRDDEIALARSAAPPSISANAEVLVLGTKGYDTAVKGTNGFVCFVGRSWASPFDDPEFWNPKERSPNCFNAPAARTELPQYLKRTEWVLAGVSKPQLIEKTRSAFADHSFSTPDPNSLAYMMSKNGYLNDQAGGPWLPHVMFFVSQDQVATWGAGLDGSPLLVQPGSDAELTTLLVPVRRWSDGSPAPPPTQLHAH